MHLQSASNNIARYGKLWTGILWLISTLIYVNIHGVVTELEAAKYVEEAKQLIETGSFSAPRFVFYSATILVIALALKLKIGMAGAFLIQALFNLFAYLLFYKALRKTFQFSLTPLLLIGYLLAFSPYQSWVSFLYTESFFFSSILILLSTLILLKPDILKNIGIIICAVLCTLISRPLGILMGLAVYFYFFFLVGRKWKIIMGGFSVVLIALGYYLVNTVFSSIHDWHITQAFEEESIICDLPAAQPYQKLDLTVSGSPVYQLWYYVTHNFNHFLNFAGVKIQYFFLMTRNYYSTAHNALLLLNVIPIYLLAGFSFFIKRRYFNKGVMAFLVSLLVTYTLTIIFQCDDYHNRFILSIYPLFVILAAGSAEHLFLLRSKDKI